MGGIQSKNALPDDTVFKEDNNPYDVAAYKRICAEFGVDPSTDFRYTRGKNGGLGTVYIWVTYTVPWLPITTIQTLTLLCSMQLLKRNQHKHKRQPQLLQDRYTNNASTSNISNRL